jgi:hypothetical protein
MDRLDIFCIIQNKSQLVWNGNNVNGLLPLSWEALQSHIQPFKIFKGDDYGETHSFQELCTFSSYGHMCIKFL